jgi:TRAP-type C4-dicarboxylate transport system substrate-binding protein
MKSQKSKPANSWTLKMNCFKKSSMRWASACCALWLVAAGLVSPVGAEGNKTFIKFATLAPEGSGWMNEMHLLDKELQKATGGEVAFKFYAGGVSGDEMDVIRKMRIGQVHGAGFTGVGLGDILPEVRVLDLPFLFRADKEVEHIYETMNDHFAKQFESKGYILLGWVPVGWVHFFSNHPIQSAHDLRHSKPWMWEGDPLVREAYSALEVAPLPLSITDVLLSLQTGIIDTVYSSPVGALALQWFTKVKYMSELRMGNASGAVLITKKIFDKLSPEHQKALREVGKKHLKELVRIIHADNAKSIEAMKKNGLILTPQPDANEIKKFEKIGETVRKNLTGKLYSQELLDRVLSHLKEVQ